MVAASCCSATPSVASSGTCHRNKVQFNVMTLYVMALPQDSICYIDMYMYIHYITLLVYHHYNMSPRGEDILVYSHGFGNNIKISLLIITPYAKHYNKIKKCKLCQPKEFLIFFFVYHWLGFVLDQYLCVIQLQRRCRPSSIMGRLKYWPPGGATWRYNAAKLEVRHCRRSAGFRMGG